MHIGLIFLKHSPLEPRCHTVRKDRLSFWKEKPYEEELEDETVRKLEASVARALLEEK